VGRVVGLAFVAAKARVRADRAEQV
jgi:hypothetical protein